MVRKLLREQLHVRSISTNITNAPTRRLWLAPLHLPWQPSTPPSITQGRKVQRLSVCVYPSFYTHQLVGAGCMARTQYRFSPLFKRSLSANNMLGSVLSAGDTGQRGRGSSYNFQGQYVWRPLWRWSQKSLAPDSSRALSSTPESVCPASTSSVPVAWVTPTPCLPVWFEYVHTKYPFFHIFMKLLDLQFYLRAKTKRHFFFTSMSSISSFFLRRMSRSSSLSSSERSSGTEIKKKKIKLNNSGEQSVDSHWD